MEISINRALSELKLLNKKITDKTARLQVSDAVQKQTKEQGEKFISDAVAGIKSIRDLIARRNYIKSKIVLSNASTSVAVGDKTMTVAEAIERKTSIELDKNLNRRMRETYYGHKGSVEAHNDKCRSQADKQAEAALGAATEGDKGIQYKAIFDAYYDLNKATLFAPDGIEKQIEDDQDKIDEFESEVDFILSESNTKTMIEV